MCKVSWKRATVEVFLMLLAGFATTWSGYVNGYSRDTTLIYATISALGVVWFVRGYYE